jgi:hypothetical protein
VHAQVRDLANHTVDPFQHASDTKATVLVFVSVECPISNRYAPTIRRLYTSYASRGIRFWLVYPNPSDARAAIGNHLREFGYPPIALRDPRHTLIDRAKATVTPEAAVFDNKSAMVYRGRIDDRFVELGRERPAPTSHDLEDALKAVLAGKRVSSPTTQAFGCFIADFK